MSTLKLNNQTLTFTPPQPLSALLEQAGLSHAHPCGGRGVCGKCAVEIEGELSPLTPAEQKAGTRLSCQTQVLGDAVMTYQTASHIQIEGGAAASSTSSDNAASIFRPLAAAIDIGTTTVVAEVYDSESGALIGSAAALNPQTAVAADVMGRIDAALNGKAALLQKQINDTLSDLLHQAAGDSFENIKGMVVTGNTTMLYLLTGRDPSALATAPFEADELFDREDSLLGIPTYYPPCISAFVGADITCALLHSGICEKEETALLCDIGTNGELALWHKGTLTVTSTAAGPVFEGAGIRQGMLGQSGAIERVSVEDGALVCRTIDDMPAQGICGSGLIDAVAAGLELELIDETGYLEEDPLPLADHVALYGQDVRNVQLAKSAIASGIGALLAHKKLEKIDLCRIAGGFGKHLNIESAFRIGLLPPALQPNCRERSAQDDCSIAAIGNAALAGAADLLLHPEKRETLRALAALAHHIELGGDPTFNELYIENMMFE